MTFGNTCVPTPGILRCVYYSRNRIALHAIKFSLRVSYGYPFRRIVGRIWVHQLPWPASVCCWEKCSQGSSLAAATNDILIDNTHEKGARFDRFVVLKRLLVYSSSNHTPVNLGVVLTPTLTCSRIMLSCYRSRSMGRTMLFLVGIGSFVLGNGNSFELMKTHPYSVDLPRAAGSSDSASRPSAGSSQRSVFQTYRHIFEGRYITER